MRPKGLVSNKCITKTCPECSKQMPTACKTCNCGFVFKRNNPPAQLPSSASDDLQRRRTGRVKKEPNYFNTMEYEQHYRRKRRSVSTSEDPGKKRKGRKSLNRPKEDKVMLPMVPVPLPVPVPVPVALEPSSQASNSGDGSQHKEDHEKVQEDLYGGLTNEKGLQYAIILAEINRKFLGQNFSPI